MRELVEQAVDGQGRRVKGRATARSVTVNRRESALAWLASRGLVSARQEEAGERLRADYERAAIGASVTMRWSPRVDGGGAPTLDPTESQLAAKRRFDGAIHAAGPGLSDVLWRVVCAGEPLAEAERGLGWPTRSARLVLAFALDRAADHYGLR
ncbi:hypothetical protein ASG29_08450 [Sphingomonas sp. Leaf412]|uniref:DUF6456 domain-containing protein n=1 Tax=Sphingomonas sp. Leaf412 TaxID=1736370 RepID=UPI0006F47457|nr:DUF6456 domain-containing protein [Sphingomonas sp. Leaf412]KQT31903.1 hypothetical protein ASG29_08450 [Sphingomonas sp. Leaf412]